MARHGKVRWTLWCALLIAVLPGASAWVIGNAGESCNTVCTGLGKTCNQARQRDVQSDYLFDWVVGAFSLRACGFYVPADSADFEPAEPLQITYHEALPAGCLSDGGGSTCEASQAVSERLCCCVGGGEDIEVVCEIPTTTSTTLSSTTTSQTTITTTSVSTTTQSVTTSTDTTKTATTTSASETSSTTLTVTTSTGTTTSQTETTTSWLTTTSTVTTQTTTSETATFTSSTTMSTTSTTATTTPRASTVLIAEVFPGDTELIVASDVGFSQNDMIYLSRDNGRTSEYVEIVALGTTTITSRRLATYPTFTISPSLESRYGAGTTVQNYGPASLFTGGDPVTYFGGNRWKFWLPLQEELLLLATPDVRIYGKVFPGPEVGMQWFDYFMLTFPDDTPIARVQVKPHANRTATASRRCASRRFETLDIFLGQQNHPLREMRKMEYTAGESVRFEINCRNQASRTEYLYFETPSIVFVITSSHAGVDFREDPRLAFKYMHLDFIVMEALRPQTYSGILPEVWEVKPRSAAVETMLQPPEPPKLQACHEASGSQCA